MRLGLVVLALCPAVGFAQTIRDSTVSVSVNKVTRIAPDHASFDETRLKSVTGAFARVRPLGC